MPKGLPSLVALATLLAGHLCHHRSHHAERSEHPLGGYGQAAELKRSLGGGGQDLCAGHLDIFFILKAIAKEIQRQLQSSISSVDVLEAMVKIDAAWRGAMRSSI